MLGRLAVSVVVAVAGAGAGCAQTVTVHVKEPHTRVWLDGRDIGHVPPEGKRAEVQPGIDPVKYVVERAPAGAGADPGDNHVGALARTEPLWWLLAGAAAGAVCCVPPLATAGFCLANPAIIAAPLAFIVSSDVGALTASCVAPSWFTLPVVAGCTGLGLAPLGLAFAAEKLPDDVVIAPAAPAPAPPGVRY